MIEYMDGRVGSGGRCRESDGKPRINKTLVSRGEDQFSCKSVETKVYSLTATTNEIPDEACNHDHRIPESLSAFWRIVSLTAAKTSLMLVVSVACVKLREPSQHRVIKHK